MGYTYLLDNRCLAQGSAPPPGATLPFDAIVLCAVEYQPELPGYAVLRVPLEDRLHPPPSAHTVAVIDEAACAIARTVRDGHRVLVTCVQGRNRSGVLSGLALVRLGVPGPHAAALIRRLRNGLTNPHFLRMVLRSRQP